MFGGRSRQPARRDRLAEEARAATRLADRQRSERTMILVRWIAIPWALLQVFAYDSAPYPAGAMGAALAFVALLVVGNLTVFFLQPRANHLKSATSLAIGSFALDVVVVSGFVWIYAFDPTTVLWAVLYVLPLEGAMRFQLRGALWVWVVMSASYLLRELWGSDRYGYLFEWQSVTFRMGIALLIALVAGLMARDLVEERTRVADAFDRLRRVDRLRAGLISTLAHDVRNPLTTIRGTHGTILSNIERLDSSLIVELLSASDRQAERLERLSSDLLDLARLDEGHLELEVVDLPLKEAVVTALSFLGSGRRVETNIDPNLKVRADEARFQQIVVNLVSNALRYGDPPFSIDASVRGRSALLAFRDHGPGVPSAVRAALFEPFQSEAEAGSVGLGLAIVKALVEAQGGSIELEPSWTQGACFVVELPLAREAGEDEEPPRWETPRLTRERSNPAQEGRRT
jgi:signal transduction histidine kinase